MFCKEVDKRVRSEMVNFLQEHTHYGEYFAHNIKVNRLGLTSDQENKAYEIIEDQDHPFYRDCRATLDDWTAKHSGLSVQFVWRSNGHLVLYYAAIRSMLPDYFMEDLRDWVKLVQDFDKVADTLRDNLIQWCSAE